MYFILFLYNSISISALIFLYLNFNKILKQINVLENSNKSLLTQNLELQRIVENLNNNTTAFKIVEDNSASLKALPMFDADEYKIFLIKLAILTLILSIGGFSIWYYYSWLKICIYSVFYKSLNLSLSYFTTVFSPLFYKTQTKQFTFFDKFDNFFTVNFSESEKIIEILIKPSHSEITYRIEELFAMHPELFNSVLNSETVIMTAEEAGEALKGFFL